MLPFHTFLFLLLNLSPLYFRSWTLIPNGQESDFSNLSIYVAPFAAFAEIFRRSMWSIFRLENEHLNNTAGYRKETHIPFHYELALNQHSKNEEENDENDTDRSNKNRQKIMEISIFVVCVIGVVIISVVQDGL